MSRQTLFTIFVNKVLQKAFLITKTIFSRKSLLNRFIVFLTQKVEFENNTIFLGCLKNLDVRYRKTVYLGFISAQSWTGLQVECSIRHYNLKGTLMHSTLLFLFNLQGCTKNHSLIK